MYICKINFKETFMATKKMTYTKALEEINEIIAEIESGDVDIDEISIKLKKAKKLFDFCQDKLKSTQASVDNLLNEE